MVAEAKKNEGSALLVVLVMLGLIALLAVHVSRSVSGAARELGAARGGSQADIDLRAGIELGVAAILNLRNDMRTGEAEAELAGRRITVRISNERARIDLNLASAKSLAGLLKTQGLDGNEATALAANVVEWRGGSASQKVSAQDDGSFGAPSRSPGLDAPTGLQANQAPKQMPTQRFFFHPIQIESVSGFSRSLARRLLPMLTVANGTNTINPFIAEAGVLNALPEASENNVDTFIAARDGNIGRDTAIQLLGVDKQLLSESAASGWRLQITTTRRGGKPRRSEAVVAAIDGEGNDPYRVVYVIDDLDR
jgi:general secretion pathway protein K